MPLVTGAPVLAGIRVIDLSQNLAGPYCAQILADLGADVVKVEPPGGDPARAWGPPYVGGDGAMFLSANRGKRSVMLDLKTVAGRARIRQEVAAADVLIESYRPGVAERLGVDAATLRAEWPRLIHCTITAYGTAGPLAGLPGYDSLAQAHGGLISVTGQPGQPARVGTSVVDFGTGMWAALAVTAALRARDQSGQGAHIVTSLYETALAYNAYHLIGYYADGTVPQPHGTGFPAIAPYGGFATASGDILIAAGNDRLFGLLCDALALYDLADDPRFAGNADRVRNEGELRELIEARTRQIALPELEQRLRAAGVPCAAIRSIDEVAAEPQTRASGLMMDIPFGDETLTAPGLPFTWDGERPGTSIAPPRLAESTDTQEDA